MREFGTGFKGEQLRGVWRMVIDLAYPPRCPSCHQHVGADGNFCGPCFNRLRVIEAPLCQCCGIPFVIGVGEEYMLCPECLDETPEFDAVRAALVYDNVSGPLVTSLKFNDQWAGLSRYVQMMLRLGRPLTEGADMLVPVPLHWRRLFRRKFNQSALLAYGLARQTELPCVPTMLQRVQHTKPQMRLDRATRLKSVKNAFAVPDTMHDLLQDKVVVLVDDVVTTGATVNACARVLKKAGAREVRVIALARAVKE